MSTQVLTNYAQSAMGGTGVFPQGFSSNPATHQASSFTVPGQQQISSLVGVTTDQILGNTGFEQMSFNERMTVLVGQPVTFLQDPNNEITQGMRTYPNRLMDKYPYMDSPANTQVIIRTTAAMNMQLAEIVPINMLKDAVMGPRSFRRIVFDSGVWDTLPELVPGTMMGHHFEEWQAGIERFGKSPEIELTYLLAPEGPLVWAYMIAQVSTGFADTVLNEIIRGIQNVAPQPHTQSERQGRPYRAKNFNEMLEFQQAMFGLVNKVQDPYAALSKYIQKESEARGGVNFTHIIAGQGAADVLFAKNDNISLIEAMVNSRITGVNAPRSRYRLVELKEFMTGENRMEHALRAQRQVVRWNHMNMNGIRGRCAYGAYSNSLRDLRVHNEGSDEWDMFSYIETLQKSYIWDETGALSKDIGEPMFTECNNYYDFLARYGVLRDFMLSFNPLLLPTFIRDFVSAPARINAEAAVRRDEADRELGDAELNNEQKIEEDEEPATNAVHSSVGGHGGSATYIGESNNVQSVKSSLAALGNKPRALIAKLTPPDSADTEAQYAAHLANLLRDGQLTLSSASGEASERAYRIALASGERVNAIYRLLHNQDQKDVLHNILVKVFKPEDLGEAGSDSSLHSHRIPSTRAFHSHVLSSEFARDADRGQEPSAAISVKEFEKLKSDVKVKDLYLRYGSTHAPLHAWLPNFYKGLITILLYGGQTPDDVETALNVLHKSFSPINRLAAEYAYLSGPELQEPHGLRLRKALVDITSMASKLTNLATIQIMLATPIKTVDLSQGATWVVFEDQTRRQVDTISDGLSQVSAGVRNRTAVESSISFVEGSEESRLINALQQLTTDKITWPFIEWCYNNNVLLPFDFALWRVSHWLMESWYAIVGGGQTAQVDVAVPHTMVGFNMPQKKVGLNCSAYVSFMCMEPGNILQLPNVRFISYVTGHTTALADNNPNGIDVHIHSTRKQDFTKDTFIVPMLPNEQFNRPRGVLPNYLDILGKFADNVITSTNLNNAAANELQCVFAEKVMTTIWGLKHNPDLNPWSSGFIGTTRTPYSTIGGQAFQQQCEIINNQASLWTLTTRENSVMGRNVYPGVRHDRCGEDHPRVRECAYVGQGVTFA